VEHTRLVTEGVSIVRRHVVARTIASCWRQDVEQMQEDRAAVDSMKPVDVSDAVEPLAGQTAPVGDDPE